MRSRQRAGALAWGVVVVALVAGLLVGCGGDDDDRAAEPPSFANGELSAEQIARYRAIYDHNNRPLQPSNARELLVSR